MSYQAIPLYGFAAVSSLEINRLHHRYQSWKYVALFSTFLPFIPFVYMAHLVQKELAAIWFGSVVLILLQHEERREKNFILAYCISFICIYGILLATMTRLYTMSGWIYYSKPDASCTFVNGSCACPANYIAYNNGTSCRYFSVYQMDAATEIFYLVGLCLLATSFVNLQNHVLQYESHVTERQKLIDKLMGQNKDLRNELQRFPQSVRIAKLDLDSPITKVTKMIRNIQIYGELETSSVKTLDYVVHLLSSNHLFEPQLKNTNMESEVNQWLQQITNHEEIKDDTLGKDLAGGANQRKWTKERSEYEFIMRPPILEALADINSWDFDIFEVHRVTNGKPLQYIGIRIYELMEFESTLGVPRAVMVRFLQKVESQYHEKNKYHNSTHAADVCHAMYYFCTMLQLNTLLQVEDLFACLIAAAIHDVDHPGYNNGFMITTSNPIALRYNDTSVLEHYHCAKGFEIMSDISCDVMEGLTPEQSKSIRSSVISMVLATDMINHFEYISKFKNSINGDGLDLNNLKQRQLLMDIAIKCGDISNTTKNNTLALSWTFRIMDEFFRQGDEESRLGLQVSPLMDRKTTVVCKCQLGFIDFIVFPLYELWDKYMNEDQKWPGMKNLDFNRQHWKRLQDELPLSPP
ncbi:High affinity cAMP-specific 3',5'-cyclic phosphodiesterase 7A [Terramyces sp. JEL0728]|nr:High affinity cAMP-specific 3',5'-cyclic phosphodiesterase 7A [Terramyces sp. JEL0728]